MIFYPVADKFLVILNHSLHCNSSFSDLKLNLHLSSNYQRGPFSTALRTHPSLLSWNRSKSLSDLSTACAASESGNHNLATDCVLYGHYVNHEEFSLPSVSIGSRCQSCPDLLQIQSLHNMHPLLREALNTNRLYYDNNTCMRCLPYQVHVLRKTNNCCKPP